MDSLYLLESNPAVMAGLFFVFGACIGSFLNVLLYRIPQGREWVKTPSACPKCGHALSAADLIPILSWAFLRGRCRYCRAPVSKKYPLVETASGLSFAILGWLIF